MSHLKAREEGMEQLEVDDTSKGPKSHVKADDDMSAEVPKPSQDQHGSSMPSPEEIIKKKYGGLLPKKPPLISKGHDHAFFDSADWELRKQGAQKSKGLLEKLRPKLEPTPHHHHASRRSAYDPPHYGEGCQDTDGIDALENKNIIANNDNNTNDHVAEPRRGDSAVEDQRKEVDDGDNRG